MMTLNELDKAIQAMEVENIKAAKRQYLRLIECLRASKGSTHSSVRESAMRYARLAKMDIAKVRKDMLAAGVNADDVDGTIKWA